jgi:chromosome segregation ATPase
MIVGELKEVLSTNEFTVSENIVSNLRESVEKDLADINKEAEHEVLQSKLDKIDALIDHKRSKLSKLDEDEDMKALTDKKKVKELEKDIKKLEQARTKVEKMLGKTKGKKKEVIDETDDDMMDENMPLDDNMMGEEMSYEENY